MGGLVDGRCLVMNFGYSLVGVHSLLKVFILQRQVYNTSTLSVDLFCNGVRLVS